MHPLIKSSGCWTWIEKALALLEPLREYPIHTIHFLLDFTAETLLVTDSWGHFRDLRDLDKFFESSSSDKMPSFPNLKGCYFHLHAVRYQNSNSLVHEMKSIMCDRSWKSVVFCTS
ncbi:hypothetical protein K435DRAFT_111072 [Dendrothele bispora CBS 962.96]|uniref:Uncharacterized protein n=1 Tax=Dendrothele bispora (strain CBS 962.96) TaxID=1314807 RepID=A0A4S8M1I5_DENBC|nr:hypothetical protein K435DRAFT_111072 [Dendrothele bispora CBS 962.96]